MKRIIWRTSYLKGRSFTLVPQWIFQIISWTGKLFKCDPVDHEWCWRCWYLINCYHVDILQDIKRKMIWEMREMNRNIMDARHKIKHKIDSFSPFFLFFCSIPRIRRHTYHLSSSASTLLSGELRWFILSFQMEFSVVKCVWTAKYRPWWGEVLSILKTYVKYYRIIVIMRKNQLVCIKWGVIVEIMRKSDVMKAGQVNTSQKQEGNTPGIKWPENR